MKYTRTFQQVVFGHPLTSKRLFINTSWKVLVEVPQFKSMIRLALHALEIIELLLRVETQVGV